MAKALDTLEAARLLIPSARTRLGARNRLYYAAHHVAVALLRLDGVPTKTHAAVKHQFGLHWVKQRGCPAKYADLLSALHAERDRADYGEYVTTVRRDLDKTFGSVEQFIPERSMKFQPFQLLASWPC